MKVAVSAEDATGVEVKMHPGKKRVKGVQSSKGGKINKKDREVVNFTKTGVRS